MDFYYENYDFLNEKQAFSDAPTMPVELELFWQSWVHENFENLINENLLPEQL